MWWCLGGGGAERCSADGLSGKVEGFAAGYTCSRRVSFALVLGSASEHVCMCVCVLHALPATLLAHEPLPVDDCSGR
jgi:hypothetical protein